MIKVIHMKNSSRMKGTLKFIGAAVGKFCLFSEYHSEELTQIGGAGNVNIDTIGAASTENLKEKDGAWSKKHEMF